MIALIRLILLLNVLATNYKKIQRNLSLDFCFDRGPRKMVCVENVNECLIMSRLQILTIFAICNYNKPKSASINRMP